MYDNEWSRSQSYVDIASISNMGCSGLHLAAAIDEKHRAVSSEEVTTKMKIMMHSNLEELFRFDLCLKSFTFNPSNMYTTFALVSKCNSHSMTT